MHPFEIPTPIQEYLSGRRVTVDPVGQSRAVVYRIEGDRETLYLKIQAASFETENSVKMMRWLQDKLPVPQVRLYMRDSLNDYLITTELPGLPSFRLKTDPNLVALLASGLKRFQQLPVDECPVNSRLAEKLERAEARVQAGDKSDWNEILNSLHAGHVKNCEIVYRFSSAEDLLKYLKDNQPNEQPAVSHGDYCLPNIYIEQNRISGFLDLGCGGRACRWHDIATCIWSLGYNLGEGNWAELLCRELDMEPDWYRITYFTLLERLM